MPNITNYELLSDSMKDYFDRENVFLDFDDEDFGNSLINNEPKGGGKDFQVYRPTDQPEDETESNIEEPLSSKLVFGHKTYKKDFTWDTDSEDDENCLKIKVGQKAPNESFEVDDSLYKVFNAVLRAKPEDGVSHVKELTPNEIMNKLDDPDTLVTLDDLQNLPSGIKKYAAQFEMFKDLVQDSKAPEDLLNVSQSSFDVHSQSLLETPSQETSSVLADISNKTNRVLRSSRSMSSTPNRSRVKTDSARLATNQRMQTWMKTFGTSSKRRRDSTSPEIK